MPTSHADARALSTALWDPLTDLRACPLADALPVAETTLDLARDILGPTEEQAALTALGP